jgi:hypothetical protein
MRAHEFIRESGNDTVIIHDAHGGFISNIQI